MSRRVVGAVVVGATMIGATVLAASGPAAARTATAGTACDGSSATGPRSTADMASAPVVTAMARSRLLTEVTRAIDAAGLTSRFNAAKAITFFAPDDSAFAALGRGNLATLLADRSDLAKVLKDHVVPGRRSPADLASAKHLPTMLGTVIVPAKSRGKLRVNNAQVVCGEIQTANATVYIVNKVLVPIP